MSTTGYDCIKTVFSTVMRVLNFADSVHDFGKTPEGKRTLFEIFEDSTLGLKAFVETDAPKENIIIQFNAALEFQFPNGNLPTYVQPDYKHRLKIICKGKSENILMFQTGDANEVSSTTKKTVDFEDYVSNFIEMCLSDLVPKMLNLIDPNMEFFGNPELRWIAKHPFVLLNHNHVIDFEQLFPNEPIDASKAAKAANEAKGQFSCVYKLGQTAKEAKDKVYEASGVFKKMDGFPYVSRKFFLNQPEEKQLQQIVINQHLFQNTTNHEAYMIFDANTLDARLTDPYKLINGFSTVLDPASKPHFVEPYDLHLPNGSKAKLLKIVDPTPSIQIVPSQPDILKTTYECLTEVSATLQYLNPATILQQGTSKCDDHRYGRISVLNSEVKYLPCKPYDNGNVTNVERRLLSESKNEQLNALNDKRQGDRLHAHDAIQFIKAQKDLKNVIVLTNDRFTALANRILSIYNEDFFNPSNPMDETKTGRIFTWYGSRYGDRKQALFAYRNRIEDNYEYFRNKFNNLKVLYAFFTPENITIIETNTSKIIQFAENCRKQYPQIEESLIFSNAESLVNHLKARVKAKFFFCWYSCLICKLSYVLALIRKGQELFVDEFETFIKKTNCNQITLLERHLAPQYMISGLLNDLLLPPAIPTETPSDFIKIYVNDSYTLASASFISPFSQILNSLNFHDFGDGEFEGLWNKLNDEKLKTMKTTSRNGIPIVNHLIIKLQNLEKYLRNKHKDYTESLDKLSEIEAVKEKLHEIEAAKRAVSVLMLKPIIQSGGGIRNLGQDDSDGDDTDDDTDDDTKNDKLFQSEDILSTLIHSANAYTDTTEDKNDLKFFLNSNPVIEEVEHVLAVWTALDTSSPITAALQSIGCPCSDIQMADSYSDSKQGKGIKRKFCRCAEPQQGGSPRLTLLDYYQRYFKAYADLYHNNP